MMSSILLTENTFDRCGCPIHYWVGGPVDAPLVVFTHGATIDHHEWDDTLPIVMDAGFRVLAWDMRGHGLSRPARFEVAETVNDLLALLDHIGVQQAIFIGHSMGGNLHQELVFHHPERVKALVMLDCTWNFTQLTRMEQLTAKLAEPIFKVFPYRSLLDQSVTISAKTPHGQAVLRTAMQNLTKDEFAHILLTALDCLHYEPTYYIPVPLLLMMADGESTGNIRKAMPLWAKHEGCGLVMIPNAKHAANLDNPAAFHNQLLAFLKKQSVGLQKGAPKS